MVRGVRILTDAVADVPRELVARYQIGILPVYVILNGQTYLDDGTLDRDWFYRELMCVESKPTTAAPAPDEYLAACEELVAEGAEDIIVLSAASSVSSLHQHALLAAQQFTGARVHVIDTLQVSMGEGWLVMETARLVEERLPVAKILERIEAMRARTSVYGVLDSIDYLRRSGRVNGIVGYMASLLKIRPLIAFEQGEARLQGKARAYGRSVQSLLDLVKEARPLHRLAILHSRADERMIDGFESELRASLPGFEIPVVDIGSVFATHVGPRCLGVALVRAR